MKSTPHFSLLALLWSLTTLNVVRADALRSIRFASPLQSLTIWDPEIKDRTPSQRSKFFDKYAAGLKAETEARKKIAAGSESLLETKATSGKDWAKQASVNERSKFRAEEEYVENAFDEATQKFASSSQSAFKKRSNTNQYQFVGVVNPATAKDPITWYARKKPSNSKWSVRLIHANRNAIIRDMFTRGKVDIFARYENTGQVDPETSTPVIASKYTVANRSWRNLWNFSPKNVFTDSSGMYWRERRLPSGLYTDGKTVYESSYRYRDGRNGMHRVSSLQQFLASNGVEQSQKERIVKRLSSDAPDIVLES